MTFLSDLRRELGARGIRGRLAARIEAEFADHLGCDPDATLGGAVEIAECFAAELRIVRTRRASIETFVALAVCAGILAVSGFGHTGGSAWAGLAVLVFGQIAFVAGTLALARGLRARTPGDLRVAQRRAAAGLVAGAGVAAGVAAEGRVPTFAFAAMALVPLAIAAAATRRAAVVTPAAAAPGLAGDLGRNAPLILFALGAIAVAGVVFQGVVFEGSAWEGIIRGSIEAGGLAAGTVTLGGLLGLRA